MHDARTRARAQVHSSINVRACTTACEYYALVPTHVHLRSHTHAHLHTHINTHVHVHVPYTSMRASRRARGPIHHPTHVCQYMSPHRCLRTYLHTSVQVMMQMSAHTGHLTTRPPLPAASSLTIMPSTNTCTAGAPASKRACSHVRVHTHGARTRAHLAQ